MKIEKTHAEENKTLSYCELNLETWRQLWRVLEISDIILVIADVRYPVSLFLFMDVTCIQYELFDFRLGFNVPAIVVRIRN